jgi:hypothetical protein
LISSENKIYIYFLLKRSFINKTQLANYNYDIFRNFY